MRHGLGRAIGNDWEFPVTLMSHSVSGGASAAGIGSGGNDGRAQDGHVVEGAADKGGSTQGHCGTNLRRGARNENKLIFGRTIGPWRRPGYKTKQKCKLSPASRNQLASIAIMVPTSTWMATRV